MAQPWWRGAVIYEIYPRSFFDADGDGIGDLPGIIERLDYVADLGVDAIWIAPFFRSPMADFGYDVADYRSVDPTFGTLSDFDRLLARARQLGLKVMIDQVVSHTSVEHEWFQESRRSRDNPKSDWYVWADPKEDGSPPTNWLSIFGGVAWRWEARRGQYYLHNFLEQQPDLNFHNPQVRRATLDNARFWLDKGVAGLRIDAVNFCYHDRLLRDNPPKPKHLRGGGGCTADNPYAFQFHPFNSTRPEMLAFLAELRAVLDEYPEAAALGEIASDDSLATLAEYTGPQRLHMGYSFELLSSEFSAAHIRATVEGFEAHASQGWPCWAISNHDVPRVVTRWGGNQPHPDLASQLTALVCSLRGSVCIYQGEELGLSEAVMPFESLRDPYGIRFWPSFTGRDGCRTPMPWRDADHGGFSTREPWLPIPPEHRLLSVERQAADRKSALNRFRAFLRWRKRYPALQWGSIRFIDVAEPVLAFVREHEASRILAAFNLGGESVAVNVRDTAPLRQIESVGVLEGRIEGDTLVLPGHGALFAQLD
jgi:alpha-glucosidase